MFTMSKIWNEWYHDLHAEYGLNNIENNSNDSENVCYHFGGDFRDLDDFMRFFKNFLMFGDPPPDRVIREYIGFSPDSSGSYSEFSVVHGVVPRVSEMGFSEFVRNKSRDVVVFGKKTVTTRFDFNDEGSEKEVVPYWFPHRKVCRVFAQCPRKTCFKSLECVHCCCSEAKILDEDKECFLAQEVFPNGFGE
jgi:hypothetical protein